MNYQALEQAIVERLAPLKPLGFDVVALPERDADFQHPMVKGRVTVIYKSSLFNDDGMNGRPMVFSTNEVLQKETAELELIIQARVIRGATGIYGLTELVRKYIVGWRPADWGRVFCKEFRIVPTEDNTGIHTYSLTINTTALVVQHNDPSNEPLISTITIQEGGSDVVVVTNYQAQIDDDMKFKQGSQIPLQFELTETPDAGGPAGPKDLTGYTFRLGIKQLLADQVVLILKAGTVSGNKVTANIPAVENVLVPGKYFAILEMISPALEENEIIFPILIEPQII